jgi:hypothetical protein
MHDCLSIAAGLTNAELLRRVVSLAGKARDATVELVCHLGELDARKLHLAEGYGSLFTYCTGALRLSEHAAYNRIEAARLSRKFPQVLDLLADGSLNLSTARLLAPHLRPDTFEGLVAQARGRSKRDVEALVARLAPRPDLAASVRRLPVRPPPPDVTESAGTDLRADPEDHFRGTTAPSVAPASEAAAPRPLVAPLAPARYRVQFTVGAATHDTLREVQDLLRREIPDGDIGAIFDRALTLLREDVLRRKAAATTKPRSRTSTRPGSRLVPAHVKRAVWLRDRGQCAFVAARGRRCEARAFLEFHHDEPYAIGGEATIDNITLRCRAHNLYESERVFGPGVSLTPRARPNTPRARRNTSRARPNSPRGELTFAGASESRVPIPSPAPPRAAGDSTSPG